MKSVDKKILKLDRKLEFLKRNVDSIPDFWRKIDKINKKRNNLLKKKI